MRLFKQTPEDYYNAPYAEFPALIRGTVRRSHGHPLGLLQAHVALEGRGR